MSCASKEAGCSGCPLEHIGTGFLQPEGSGSNGVLILGEAAGEAEAASSLPFRPYASAGSVLERAIKRCRLTREQFVIHNVVNCRPPGNKLEGQRYERAAVEQCSQYLRRTLDTYRPRVILALGGVALRAATGLSGKDCGILDLRGFILPSQRWGIPVVPSLHPSYIRAGNSALLGVLIRDLSLAVQVGANGVPFALEQKYNECPTVQQAEECLEYLRQRPSLPIAYDIETDWSPKSGDESEALGGTGKNITQIQFSHQPGQAIVFQWQGAYVGIAKQILALPNLKLAHNGWIFDEAKLRDHGVHVQGPTEDTMWMWHHIQPDLPKKLQFVTSFYAPTMEPWKHLSRSNMTWYGGCDVDSVSRMYPALKAALQKEGLEDSYRTYVSGLQPCLQRMSQRGIPLNPTARDTFSQEIDKEAQELYVQIQRQAESTNGSLIKLHPEQGYKTKPSEPQGLELRRFHVELPVDAPCPTCGGVGTVAGKREGTSKKCPKCHGRRTVKSASDVRLTEVDRWCRVDGFNPDSSLQLFDYMRFKRHPVPTDRTGKRTSDSDALSRLARSTGDEFYTLVERHRAVGKIKDTYLAGEGWTPDSTGRIHSSFGYSPATWQLNSKDPNIQNIPKHGDLAAKFRSCIAARPGFTLAEFDYSGFHAVTLGFEAECPSYMRLARLDPHSYLAAQFLRLPEASTCLELNDTDLQAYLAEIKKNHKDVRDQKAKPAMHGYGFGIGGYRLYSLNPESFDSVKEAQYILDVLDETFPAIKAYREATRFEAHTKGVLRSRYGAIRRFYDVYTWDGSKGDWRPGEQFNETVAFRPANDAFGKVRDVMLALEEGGYNDRFNLILNNHDSLLFECPNKDLDTCIQVVSTEMESPALPLTNAVAPTGLRCGIEAMVGSNWYDMKKVYGTPLERVM